MKTTRVILLSLALAFAAVAVAPGAAAAGPVCVQVYPWSELCNGNAGRVVCYYAESLVNEIECESS